MSTPKPGGPEWQTDLDRQIAEHDRQQRESANENATFEIGQSR